MPKTLNIPAHRRRNQFITRPFRGGPADLVASLGAVQAQEYPFAKWGLGLRLGKQTTDADIEQAFAAGEILRTHVMRPTWHFVAAPDINWMLELTGPRVHLTLASYLRRQELDGRLLARATTVLARALEGGRHLTRAEVGAHLASAGIKLVALQLGLLMLYAELDQVVCSGPRRGKQFTYALLEERVRRVRRLSHEEALAELATRYFDSHGPATVRDFVWWSGLKTTDARRGLDMIKARRFTHDGLTYWDVSRRRDPLPQQSVDLLPIYDEYLIAYRDRLAVPHTAGIPASGAVAVTFRHALVIDGQVAGTWRTTPQRSTPTVHVTPLRPLTKVEQRGLDAAAERYGKFMGTPMTVSTP